MTISFVKLLPEKLRETKWKDFVGTFQVFLYEDLKAGIYERIYKKNLFQEMTAEELVLTAYQFGFPLTQGNGYTETIGYLQKEIRTIVPRIKYKTALKGYLYILYIFLMTGTVYPLLLGNTGYLEPWVDWFDFLGEDVPIIYLDTGHTLDDDPSWTLDNQSLLGSLTRHFVIDFEHLFIENEDEFVSEDTLRAFYNDVHIHKKVMEIPHFRQVITMEVKADLEYIKTFISEDEVYSAEQNSYHISANGALTDITKIQFGKGTHTTLDGSITDVDDLIQQFTIGESISNDFVKEINIISTQAAYFKMQEDTKFLNNQVFTEIAFKSDTACIAYIKFPERKFFSTMLSSLYLNLNLIS